MPNYEKLYNLKDSKGNTFGSKVVPKGKTVPLTVQQFGNIYFKDLNSVTTLFNSIVDKRKQYPNSVYFRMAILIYVACFATIYISKLAFLQPGGLSNQQQGGGVAHIDNTQSFMPSANEIKNNFENFKTGIPTF